MATTQLPVDGVFDKDTGRFVGVANENGDEISIATLNAQGDLIGASGSPLLTVSEITSLKSLASSGGLPVAGNPAWQEGQTITVAYRAVPGDGGGGVFTYSATSVQPADGGIVIGLTGGGKLFRQGYTVFGFRGDISPYWWAGDISAASNTDEGILAALDYCAANNGGSVILPPGSVWADTAEWKIPSYTSLGCRAKPRAKVVLSAQTSRRQISNRTINTVDTALTNPGIKIFGIEFDGSAKDFPVWLSRADGTPVTDPWADYLPGGCLAPTTQATATATVSAGAVSSYTVVSGGSGYVYPPTAIVTGDGFFATANVTISGGVVTGITPRQQGEGYTTATIQIVGGGADPSTALYAANRRNQNWSRGLDMIVLFKADRPEIYDCKFTSYHATTIADQGCDELLVHDNEWFDCGQIDFVGNCLWSQAYGSLSSPTASTRQSTNTRFYNNKIKKQRRSVCLLGGADQWAYDNEIDGWGESCFYVNNWCTRATIHTNKAKGGRYTDITCAFVETTGTDFNRIYGNQVSDCQGPYIILGGPGRNIAKDNVLSATAPVGRLALPYSPFSERVGYQQGTAAIAGTYEAYKDSSFIVCKSQAGIIPSSLEIVGNTFVCPTVNWIRDCIGVLRGPLNGMTGEVLIQGNNKPAAATTLYNVAEFAQFVSDINNVRVLANFGHSSLREAVTTRELVTLTRTATSATATDLTTDGAALGATNFYLIPANSLRFIRLTVTARTTALLSATAPSAVWVMDLLVQRGNLMNSGALAGGPFNAVAPTRSVGTGSTFTLTVAAKTTGGNGQGGLMVQVAGDGTTPLQMTATIEPLA